MRPTKCHTVYNHLVDPCGPKGTLGSLKGHSEIGFYSGTSIICTCWD